MDRPFHDARRRQPQPADGQAPAVGDGDDADGPRFLPPLRRSGRSDRSAARPRPLDDDDLDGLPTLPAWAELTDDWPPPPARSSRPPKAPPAPAPRMGGGPSAPPRAAARTTATPAPCSASPPAAQQPSPMARPTVVPAAGAPAVQRVGPPVMSPVSAHVAAPTTVPASAPFTSTPRRPVAPLAPRLAEVPAPDHAAPVPARPGAAEAAPLRPPEPPDPPRVPDRPDLSPAAAAAAPSSAAEAPLLFDAAQLQEVAQWLQPAPLPEPDAPTTAEPPAMAAPATVAAPAPAPAMRTEAPAADAGPAPLPAQSPGPGADEAPVQALVEPPAQAPAQVPTTMLPPAASPIGDSVAAPPAPAQAAIAAPPPSRVDPPRAAPAATSIEAAWGGAGRAGPGAATLPLPPLPFPGQPPLPGLPMGRPPRARWLRPDFPWLAPLGIGLLASAVVVGGLVASLPSLVASFSPPASAGMPVAQRQLRQLVGQMEECRGTESLLVMLSAGPERTATLARLQAQQRRIDVWLRDNGAWIAASQGAQAATELREASAAWRVQQQRIAEADATQARTGLARESRQLFTGPSAAAYRRMLQLVEAMSLRQAS